MNIGPDAFRLLHLADGGAVPRPFHLRFVLPMLCGRDLHRWWIVWGLSWPLAAVGMLTWRLGVGDDWRVAAAATALLLGLPGVLGPRVAIPIGVDLPALAWSLVGVSLFVNVHPVAGVAAVALAAGIKEQAPAWSALWLWQPWLLVALVVPVARGALTRSGPDPIPTLQYVTDHPIRAALQHHAGRWRDGWLWVAPWGVVVVAVVEVDWRLAAVLLVAHAQVIVATDAVRLVQSAAGPAMAVAAAHVIPVEWLALAVVLHVFWFWKVERV